jgi:hypothetical protein
VAVDISYEFLLGDSDNIDLPPSKILVYDIHDKNNNLESL